VPESSSTEGVLFHRRVTITSRDGTLNRVDVKSLHATLDDVIAAVLTMAGITGTWITSWEVTVRSAAGVSTIYDGPVPNAIGNGTPESS